MAGARWPEARLERAIGWLLTAWVGLLAAPLFAQPGALPFGDGDPDHFQRLSFCRTLRDSVLRFGEYPLWTPYFGGGFAFVGSPDNPGVSPLSLFCVAAPEALALRLWVVFNLWLGCWGLYGSAREWLALGRAPALLAALLYSACLWAPGRLLSGNYHELPLFALPFYALCLLRLLQRRFTGLWLPLLFAMGFDAKFGGLVLPAVVLAFALLYRKNAGLRAARIAAAWAVALGCGLALALHRLLPTLLLLCGDLVEQSAMVAGRGYRGLGDLLAHLAGGGPDPNLWLGVGWLGSAAAASACALAPRRALGLLTLGAAAALFELGDRSPLPISALFSRLPLLEAMKPGKYANVVIAFALSGLAGLALEVLQAKLAALAPRSARSGPRTALAAAAIAAVLAQPLALSRPLYGEIFVFEDFDAPAEPFHQIASLELEGVRTRYRYADPRFLEVNQYYNLRRNVGTITWYGGVVLPEHAVPRYAVDAAGRRHPRADYRGEVYCAEPASACRVADLRVGYARLSFRASNARWARVVLNFNHDPRWSSEDGAVVEQDGLLAIELPPGGEREIRLAFSDPVFAASLAAGAAAALAWLLGGMRWVRGDLARRGAPPGSPGPVGLPR